MSHPNTTRRKHVLKEMMEDDYSLPTEQQQIVRVVSSRGNNLHEVEAATAENFLGEIRGRAILKTLDFIVDVLYSLYAQQVSQKCLGKAR